ncbi:MAG TPA: histidine phosphatase family protein [Acidimicrobiales bacterium]|nr:histidine phosphatase family protein [Acidimicrobiales bacterium]
MTIGSIGQGSGDSHAEDGVSIVLVRHGRTELNAAGRLRGRLDPDLDDTGRHEARSLASWLAASPVSRVVSSPLRRAVETATPIASRHDLQVDLDCRLIDRDYAGFAGTPRGEVLSEWGSLENAPNVEPLGEVYLRARHALDETAEQLEQGCAVVVAHDAVNRALLAQLLPGLPPPEAIEQPTGCLNLLRVRSGQWRVVAVALRPAKFPVAPSRWSVSADAGHLR